MYLYIGCKQATCGCIQAVFNTSNTFEGQTDLKGLEEGSSGLGGVGIGLELS